MPSALLIIIAVLINLPVALAQTPAPIIAHTELESTRFDNPSDEAMTQHWGLSTEELAHYRRYMALAGRYFYAHLDPVMVLGIIETDLAKRREYADQYLKAERQRVGQQTSFATLVAARQRVLYGPEPLFDFSTLPQATNSSGYLKARAERLGSQTTATVPTTPEPLARVEPQSGDTLDVLIKADCLTRCYEALNQALPIDEVKINLYGRGFTRDADLISWLTTWEATQPEHAAWALRIELKRYDPVAFADYDIQHLPLVLVRREGQVIGQFAPPRIIRVNSESLTVPSKIP